MFTHTNQEPLKVLVLGPHSPPSLKLLHCVKNKIRKMNHIPLLAKENKREIRDVWSRVINLMNEADCILLLVENIGGIVLEQAIVGLKRKLCMKCLFLVDENTRNNLSGMITKGLFLQPGVKVLHYRDKYELLDTIDRFLNSFQYNKTRVNLIHANSQGLLAK